MNTFCEAVPCPVILNATCVFYEAGNLICTGINTNDSLEMALIKIDQAICNLNGTAGTSGTSGSSGTAGTSGQNGDRYRTPSYTTTDICEPALIIVNTALSYSAGQKILISHDQYNSFEATVTSYNSSTGELVFTDPINCIGSGTYSSWVVNLSGASGGDGSSGTSGTNGTSGSSGTNGRGGSSGTSGLTGSSGVNGTSGTSGSSGSKGSAGSSGSSGFTGSSGTSGLTGSSGLTGTSGTSGINGTSGTNGTFGTSGSNGTNGTSGFNGTNGTNGTSGTRGTSGTSGITGTSGTNGTSGSSGSTTIPNLQQVSQSGSSYVATPGDPGISITTYTDEPNDIIASVPLTLITDRNRGLVVNSAYDTCITTTGNIGLIVNASTIGIDASGPLAISAVGTNVGIYAYGTNGVAGIFNITSSNTSNIVEFQKNNINQAYITSNGTIVGNKLLVNTTDPSGTDSIKVEGTISVITSGNNAAIASINNNSGNGVYAESNVGVGVHGYSNTGTGIFAEGDQGVGLISKSNYKQAGIFDIDSTNTSNIVEFKNGLINQAYVTHDGTVVSNRLLVNTTDPSGTDSIKVNGSIVATSIKKSGGLPTEFLKADGSVSTLTNPITGTGTTNYVPKFTGASALGNSSIFDNGNVGIGVATPTGKFHVYDTTPLGGTIGDYRTISNIVMSTSATDMNLKTWSYRERTGTNWTTAAMIVGVGMAGYNDTPMVDCRLWWKLDPYANKMQWGSAASPSITLQTNGTFGIGTVTPEHKLSIEDLTKTDGILVKLKGGQSYGAGLQYWRQDNYHWTTGIGPMGGATLSHFTISENSITPRLSIASGGNVLIGTTADNGIDNLQVDGSILAKEKIQISSVSNSILGFDVNGVNTGSIFSSNNFFQFNSNNSFGFLFKRASDGLNTLEIDSAGNGTFLGEIKRVSGTSDQILLADGSTSSLSAKANLASPTFTGTVVLPSTTSIGNVSAVEIGYLDNVTSPIQTQLDSTVKVLLNEFPNTSVTGFSIETLVSTFTFPANTFPANSLPNFKLRFSKAPDGGASTIRIKFNTTNNFATSTLLANYLVLTTVDSFFINRTPFINGGNLRICTSGTSLLSDEAITSTTTESVFAFNTAATIYLFVSIENTTPSDATTVTTFRSIKIIN